MSLVIYECERCGAIFRTMQFAPMTEILCDRCMEASR